MTFPDMVNTTDAFSPELYTGKNQFVLGLVDDAERAVGIEHPSMNNYTDAFDKQFLNLIDKVPLE